MNSDSTENETKSKLADLKLTRRSLLGAVPLTTAGLSLASLAGAAHAEAQQARPQVRPEKHKEPPLENFKYDLDASTGFAGEAGTAKEVTVAEFPDRKSVV